MVLSNINETMKNAFILDMNTDITYNNRIFYDL